MFYPADSRIVGTTDDAVGALKAMVAARRETDEAAAALSPPGPRKKGGWFGRKAVAQSPPPERFDLTGVHIGKAGSVAADQTMDSVLSAFVRWSQKPDDAAAGIFNISKAMRRLDTFATFQHEHLVEYFDTPVGMDTAELTVW